MYKQVVVVRRDLKLDKGKLAVQVAHASLDAYRKADPALRDEWENSGGKKVVARVETLKEMLDLYQKARKMGLPCSLIKDAGKTHIQPGTITAIGIGPCEEEELDKVTGGLKIL
jgi:PTH2 family peptidyl-tRNA hydrolase